MKCTKCKKNNSYKAKYCFNCGNKFNEKQIEKAKTNKFVNFIKVIKEAYDAATLSVITSNIWFRVGVIIGIIGIGLFGIFKNGASLSIKSGDNYTYQYNKVNKEYYVYTKNDKTKLNLYTLTKDSDVTVKYYDEDNKILNSNTYDDYDKITLDTNTYANNYYIISNKRGKIKVFVYLKG